MANTCNFLERNNILFFSGFCQTANTFILLCGLYLHFDVKYKDRVSSLGLK